MVAARDEPEVDQAGCRRRSGDNAGVDNPGVDNGAGPEDGPGAEDGAGGTAPSPKSCHGVSLAVAVSAGSWLRPGGHIEYGAAVKESSGRSLKPTVSTGMMGQSSVRGKWVRPKVCQTTMSCPSMSRSWAT